MSKSFWESACQGINIHAWRGCTQSGGCILMGLCLPSEAGGCWVSFVTQAGQGPAELAAGHGGRSSAGSRVAAAASSPASFSCPAGQRSLPAWLPSPEAFPLLLGEGGGSFFVSFPPPVCLQPGLPVLRPGALTPPKQAEVGCPGMVGWDKPGG